MRFLPLQKSMENGKVAAVAAWQNIKEIAPHQIQAKVVQKQNSIVQKLILKVAAGRLLLV